MKLLKIVAGSLGLLALLENFRELHDFRVTEYEITSEKLAGLEGEASVLFLSDLHNHRYGRGNQRLLEAVWRKTAILTRRRWNLSRRSRILPRCITPTGTMNSGSKSIQNDTRDLILSTGKNWKQKECHFWKTGRRNMS